MSTANIGSTGGSQGLQSPFSGTSPGGAPAAGTLPSQSSPDAISASGQGSSLYGSP